MPSLRLSVLRRAKNVLKRAPILRRIIDQRDELALEVEKRDAQITQLSQALEARAAETTRLSQELGLRTQELELRTQELGRQAQELKRLSEELSASKLDISRLSQESAQLAQELKGRPVPLEGQHPAFAHWGEDQIVGWLFEDKRDGFYIDVGAYHPSVASNTKLLFDRGWRGINIDCNPYMIGLHRQERPGDVNLQIAIAGEERLAKYFVFNDWASSNTLSRDFAHLISEKQSVQISRELEVQCLPLRTVFERYVPAGQTVHFLNVDVEAVDLEVIESNDWSRYRPLVVAIEDLAFRMDAPADSAIYRFMTAQGYRIVSRAIFTNFFIDEASRHLLENYPEMAQAKRAQKPTG